MMNSMLQSVPQGYMPFQGISTLQSSNLNDSRPSKVLGCANEQSMAITFDISAEYSAISKMNTILSELTQEIKQEKNPERKKILESRINTINTMILQREARINQMEQIRAQIDNQVFAKN